jgi:hypothetical protein
LETSAVYTPLGFTNVRELVRGATLKGDSGFTLWPIGTHGPKINDSKSQEYQFVSIRLIAAIGQNCTKTSKPTRTLDGKQEIFSLVFGT